MTGVGLDVTVDVDALLLAVHVDGGGVARAVDDDLAVDRLDAVAGEALLIAYGLVAEPLAPLARVGGVDHGRGRGGEQSGHRQSESHDEDGAGEKDGDEAARRHCFTCTWSLTWQASHMLCG